jgi:tetratricopeptide (TPR) repeat protein/predicted Ser/Thr protein kinase
MNLEDLLDAHLASEHPVVPDSLRADFDRALAGHKALCGVLAEAETVGWAVPADRPPPVLPEDYEIVRELGRGGMGVVYLVRQKSLGRHIAVKVLRPGEATFAALVQRFLEEARHLARLRHPNIVSVHEVGRAGDEPYFTMDYVEGEPLSARLARGRLTPSEALAILKQAAAGVQHAHAHGIIHRDLKPGNILIDSEGRAYVTDFGLARDMTQVSTLTRPGEVMGTPAYMAPEQALGQSDLIGETTDVHALGVILYEMLTGRTPYGSGAPVDVLVRLMMDEPAPPRKIDRRIPRDLETICLKALAKAPQRRYPTVRAFLEDLRRFEAGLPVQARRPGLLFRGARLLRRHWKLAATAALSAVLVLALSLLFFRMSPEELIVRANEAQMSGQYAAAISLYRRAARWTGSDATRAGILERLIYCCRKAEDADRAVEAAMEMLTLDPDAWFGEYDYAVAQTVLARRPTIKVRPFFGITREIRPLELAEKRLQAFLNGPYGSDAERQGAEEKLAELRQALGKEPVESMPDSAQEGKLLAGTPEDLLRRAGDPRKPALERAACAYSAGRQLERAGEARAAVEAYRRAYELIRRLHPVYAGVVFGLEMSHPRSLRLEPQGSRMLRHVAQKIRRLDPAAPNPLRGGIRLRITGLDLPPEQAIHLAVSLTDVGVKEAQKGKQPRSAPEIRGESQGSAPVQLDQTAWVGVADGRYRLAVAWNVRGSVATAARGARAGLLNRRMKLDFSALPAEVVIAGKTVELAPIRAYLAE